MFLTLSEHEGFCIPVVEAMATGVPVVAAARAAIPDTVADAGLLVDDPDDPVLVAGVLQRALTDDRLRHILVGRGVSRAKRLSAAASLPQLVRAIAGSAGLRGAGPVKLTFVVQRYGAEVVGGAEKYVRRLAEGLAADGPRHRASSPAAPPATPTGPTCTSRASVEQAGVTVHRVPVRAPRDNHRFTPLHLRAIDVSEPPLWPWAQDRWAQTMGPDLADVAPVLAARRRRRPTSPSSSATTTPTRCASPSTPRPSAPPP